MTEIKRFHMPKRLLDMAVQTVFDNIDSYDKTLVKQIIEPIRREKLEEIIRMAKFHSFFCNDRDAHVDKVWAALPILINSKLYTKLDTTVFTHMNCNSSILTNSRFQEFVRCLGVNTPNLEMLTINSQPWQDLSLGEGELASILKLKNLTHLKITCVSVSLTGFLLITRHCKELKSVGASDVEVDVEPSYCGWTSS
ncbi:Hypothetical predicted protein [Cloeon dipterum]|uniref:Uncharacterized protein n=1 Tax=Cloeon dipterum TaxID=197152 RepID=A0A8S1CJ12_9INSE|nr:Hypothetical predicted protein [Cloeon dipterum]